MMGRTCIRWLRNPLRLALAVLPLVAGCEPPGKPNPADRPKMPDQVLAFDTLYKVNCAGCHGATGRLGPAPPLNDPLFVAIVSDAELETVIRDGRDGTPMPPFLRAQGGSLTAEQVKVIVDGIRSHWQSAEPPAQTPPAYALSTTAGSRERGAQVFARACAGCHGADGKGVERDGAVVDAINVPAFLALISDQAIRRIIITGRSDLGMPNYAQNVGRPQDFQPLTAAEIDDLVALIAEWRAAGKTIVQTGK